MKIAILLVPLSLFTIPYSYAQRVLLKGDTLIQISIDSTGYVESHPHDIPDEVGLFIYSKDGHEALRIYGSFRFVSVWDNRKNLHAYDLTQPTIPTGTEDFHYPNSIWNINMSRLGFDALIGSHKLSDMLIRIEMDWKGTNEKFRIRHLFLRSGNWLVGKSWSSFNNVSYLLQAIDGRFAGGGIGTRPPQLRYYNQTKRWKYQFSLEYSIPSLVQPDTLGAESINLIPNLAYNISYESSFLSLMLAGVLRSNQVQYTKKETWNQNLAGYGGVFAVKLEINEKNRLKSSAGGGVGIGGLLADYAYVPIDLAYNPSSHEFENVRVFTGFVGLEHDWSNQFTSSLGLGVTSTQEQLFFNDGLYKNGRKIITNIFYRPKAKLKNLVMAAEVEYAERRNIETPSNNTTRVSFLMIYDF